MWCVVLQEGVRGACWSRPELRDTKPDTLLTKLLLAAVPVLRLLAGHLLARTGAPTDVPAVGVVGLLEMFDSWGATFTLTSTDTSSVHSLLLASVLGESLG